jgi:hypothetical protein
MNICYNFILKYPCWFYFMQCMNSCYNVWKDCNICRLQCMNRLHRSSLMYAGGEKLYSPPHHSSPASRGGFIRRLSGDVGGPPHRSSSTPSDSSDTPRGSSSFNTRGGGWCIYALIYILVINDDPYFWTNKFIEMIIVLVEIRKGFSCRYCIWMTQDKGIMIGLSILSVKVISGEMTGLLE